MNLKIEIIGLPASGKTYFYDYLNKVIKKRKINYIQAQSLKSLFLIKYKKKKTKISSIKKLIYSFYARKIQIKSNYLFKEEYKDLDLFVKKNLKEIKGYNKIASLYKNYVSTTDYKKERKFRMLKNFEIDFLGNKFINSKYNFNIFDEGFFQKIFFKFHNNNNLKFGLNKQINYLKSVPKPNLIFFIDTNIETCLDRSKKRKGGFIYDNNLIKKSQKIYFNKSVINFSKLKKIPIIRLNGASSVTDNLKIFFKTIKNYKNYK